MYRYNPDDPRYRPTYDPAAVQYMRDELTAVGFEELLTPEAIDRVLDTQNNEYVLLVINSVCGCAAGGVRPGVAYALQHSVIPDRLVTSFAGMDKLAVEYLRHKYLSRFTPSSPNISLFQNGKLLFHMQRKDLVDKAPEEIGEILRQLFDHFCTRPGPSIPPEKYDALEYTIVCSSHLPKYQGS